jgi:TonB-linked SusC/RagA family outer membrane protein
LHDNIKAKWDDYVFNKFKNMRKKFIVLFLLCGMAAPSGYAEGLVNTLRDRENWQKETGSEKTVTLQMQHLSYTQALKKIAQAFGLGLAINSDLIPDGEVELRLEEATLGKALDAVLKETSVFAVISPEGNIMLRERNEPQVPQQQNVKGKVTSESGEPLPGVNVTIKGTVNGTTTGSDGNFTINNISSASTLVFSFIGMKTLEVPVSPDSGDITVVLQENHVALNEVVAIGYGSVQRKDLTSSITTISSGELNKGVIRDPVMALQGKVPGLNITKDGSPYGGASIILRGASTLRGESAQEPFFIVDGMPNAIMPSIDDIVSIDILRDASATAIYGSRAANGVIIITTRKGESGKQLISYNGYVAIESVSNKIDMLSADEYRKYLADNGLSISPDDEHEVNTDWQNEMTRPGISYKNNLSISGGNNKTTYISSVEHYSNEGIIIGTKYERIKMRGLIEQYGFNNKLKLQFQLGGQIGESNRLIDLETVLSNMLQHQPTRRVRNEDGTFPERETAPFNPVALVEQHKNDYKDKTMFGNIRADLNLAKGLDYVVNTSFNNGQSNGSQYYSKLSRIEQGSNGKAVRSTYETQSKLIETYASYTPKINRHNFTLLAGYSWQEDKSGDGFQSSNVNFITDDVGYYNLGLGSGVTGYIVDYGTTAMKTIRMISGYARLNYEFNDKYLLQATVRRDGSSAFGENNRWGTFPSVSAGWRLMEEPFIKNLDVFDNLKLRAGYGTSGNAMAFDPLISLLRYGDGGSFYYQGEWITGITPTQNENPDLKWERTNMLNLGLDFGVLKGRLRGTVEYYEKITKDMIWSYDVPATQFFVDGMLANVGEMENKGWEFSISAIPARTKNFSWTSSLNLSFNKNKVNTLSNEIYKSDYDDYYGVGQHGQSGNMAFRLQEGYPIGQFCLWEYRGENEEGISQFTDADDSDGDEDGLTINPSSLDRMVTDENAQPKATGGWQNTFTYRNFSLDFLLRGVTGNYILNATRADLNYPAEILRYNVSKETLNEPANNIRSNYTSTRYLEKGDYLRLDNVTLSYSPNLRNRFLRKLTVYSTVNNAFVITKYKGIDPEIDMGGLSPGIDDKNFYPKTRSFIFGVNVEF